MSSPTKMSKMKRQKIGVDKDIQQVEHLLIGGGNEMGTITSGNGLAVSA